MMTSPDKPGPVDLDLGADTIDVADEEAFEGARAWLLDAHRSWLSDNGLPTDDWVAFQVLHYKWGYLDGHLGRWRVADLGEILLELFPRKVIVDDADLPDVVPAVGRFLRFLDDAGLLDRDSHPLPRLRAELERLVEPFLTRMRDSAGFGLAKSLFAGMIDEGVDPGDHDAVEAWMANLNTLPDEERARLLPGPPSGPRGVMPMVLPDDTVLAAAAVDTQAMRRMAAFLDWVGDGRALTQKGNLKLADGRTLVELLGTGDRFDETIGDRTFKTHSTTDLPGVDLVFRLALKARLARRYKGRLQRTKRGARLAGEPLATWRALVDAMIDIGLVDAGREDRYGWRWWADYLEDGVVDLLTAAAASRPLPVRALSDAAFEGLGEVYDLDSLPDLARTTLPDSLASGVGALVDRLVWLGVATREGVVMEPGPLGDPRPIGGELELTDLGRWFVRPLLIAKGYDVADAATLADASADVLLTAVADRPVEVMHAHVRAWAAARDDAASELGAAARQASDPGQRALAFAALEIVGDEALPMVRALADDPDVRPWAISWLVARGHAQPEAFEAADAQAGFVQALAVSLVSGGPDLVSEMLATGIPTSEQTAIVGQLWRVDDPYTAPVLEALAESADRKVAKAARKALFKRGSVASGPDR